MRIIYYVEVNFICILLLLLFGNIFLRKLKQQSSENILFNCMLFTAIVFCVSDMIAGIFRGQMFAGARAILNISNWMYYETLSIIACLWLFYVSMRLNHNQTLPYRKILLYLTPLIIYTLISLMNFKTGFMFTINEQNLYVRGEGIIFHWIMTWGYLVVSTVMTCYTYFTEKSKMKKEEIKPFMYFIIAPTIASFIQMLFYGVTSTQVGITLSIVMICITNQNSQILTDPLTGLNNGRVLNSYFESYLNHPSTQPFMLMMIDINGFKKINDTFGHVMGDTVLKEVSKVLKNECKTMTSRLFICRYGGDEFLIAGFLDNEELIEQFKHAIHDSCKQIHQKATIPCVIEMSIGYAYSVCHDNNELEVLINQADLAMYREKPNRKNSNKRI